MLKYGCKAEIGQLTHDFRFAVHVHLDIDHDVLSLKISMDNTLLMHIVQSHQDLFDDLTSIFLGKILAVRYDVFIDFHKITMLNQFHDKVKVLVIGKELENMNDMGMVKALQGR